MQKMGPLDADHPLVNPGQNCPACGLAFRQDDYVTLISLGPGDDEEARALARAGRPYNAVALPVHWACATGQTE